MLTTVARMLHGITRLHLLRLARQLGISVDERAVSVNELKQADEAIICSSIKGAMAITTVDEVLIGDGKPGPVTRRIMEAWDGYCASN